MEIPNAAEFVALSAEQIEKLQADVNAEVAKHEAACCELRALLDKKRKNIEELKEELRARSIEDKRLTTLQRFKGTNKNKLRLLAGLLRAYMREKYGEDRIGDTYYSATTLTLVVQGKTAWNAMRFSVDLSGKAGHLWGDRRVNILNTHPREWKL